MARATRRALDLEGDLTLTHGPDRLRVRALGQRVRVDLPSLAAAFRLRRLRRILPSIPGVSIEIRWRGLRLATIGGT